MVQRSRKQKLCRYAEPVIGNPELRELPDGKDVYKRQVKEFLKYTDASWEGAQEKAIEYAIDKVRRECDQGWQGIEYKLNTVGSLSLIHI